MSPLFPKEHGLWCWAGVPLLGALALAPTPGAALAIPSVLCAFGAGNAARAGEWRPAIAALVLSGAFALAAIPLLPDPGIWLLAFGGMLVAGMAALATTARTFGRRVKGHTAYELGAIGGFGTVGAAIAVAAGAPLGAALAVTISLLTWQVIGLWWVRRELARVLPGREPWAAGVPVVAALVTGSAAATFALGLPLLAPVPALYAGRIWATRPVTSGRDARRIGLSEAAWATGAVLLAAALTGLA